MTLSFSGFLVIVITAILHVHAFSQGENTALSCYNSGAALVSKNPEQAFQLLEKAMHLSYQNKDWDLHTKSINTLAAMDFEGRQEQENQVFEWLKKAAQLLKNERESNELAQLHYNVGQFYNKLTIETDPPIYHYQRAKKIWTALQGEWTEEVSNCYHGLGDIYKYYKFDFHEAEKCYERALLIRDRIHFQDLDVLYKNYYNLATTNRSQRDFEKALSYGTKTLEIAQRFGPANKFGALRVEMSNGMIANIYRDMKESSLAKKYYLTALAVNKDTKDLATRAWYYSSLGETFKNDSLFDEALDYFIKAHTLYKSPEVKDQELFLNLLENMLETYSLMGDEENVHRISKTLLSELGSLDMLYSARAAQVFLKLSDHHQRKVNYDSAVLYIQRSLMAYIPSFKPQNFLDNPTEDMIGFRYDVSEILAKKASVLKKKFSREGASEYLLQSLATFRLAEKLLSQQRNTLDMENAKWEFLEYRYDLYEDILSILYAGAKDIPRDSINLLAFQYFEQSKARSLADALAQAERTQQISGNDSLFRLHADLKRHLFSVQDDINQELRKAGSDQEIVALREEMVRIDQKIQACKFAIEEKFPGYFNVKYGYRPISLTTVQSIMAAKDQVLLEYFWGNESVYAIAVSEEIVSFKKIGTPDSIMNTINKVLAHLTDAHSSTSPDPFNLFVKNSSALYELLVDPFATQLSGKKSLQVIPDGAISQIPFEILLEEAPAVNRVNYRSLKYLIKSITVGYAYSSAMLLQKNILKRSNPSLLAVGFTGGRRLRASSSEFEEIAGTEEELKALERRFHSGKFLVGANATESNFKALAPNFDILHLAVHGTGDTKKNFSASLYFRSKYDTLDDGELHAYELYGLKLKARMAVLSSCESGIGKGYKGEGMISMASAFTYSGCENILMSLWKVNDQTAISLMDNFYEHLLEGNSIDGALRQAKLSYLESSDELTADPKVWAPLVAYGHLDKIFERDMSRIYIVTVLVFLAFLLLSFNIYKRFKNR